MNGETGLTGRTLAIGVGLLVVVAVAAGAGGYELGLRAPRTTAMLTSSGHQATGTPAISASPIGQPAPTPPPPRSTPSGSANVPAPRSNPSWVYDSVTGRFLLYGGFGTTGRYNEFPQPIGDSWLWDGSAWKPVSSVTPSPRFGTAATFDDSRKVVLLFGGFTGSGADSPYTDTWTFDGTRWLQMGPAQSPPHGFPLKMTFDSAHRIAVLLLVQVSYAGAPASVQTWTWDGNNWSQSATAAQPPVDANTGGVALAYDPGRKTVVCFGSSATWTFDGTNWTRLSTNTGTPSTQFVMSRDDAKSNIVLFDSGGGTWTWNGTKWTPANPIHSPGPRQGMAMSYDSAHGVVTLFGGQTGQGSELQHHNDIWSWDGTDWTHVSGS